MLLPARARHGRAAPRRGAAATGLTWLLVTIGVVMLAAAAVVSIGPSQEPAPAAAAAPVPAERPVELEIPAMKLSVAVSPVGLTAEQHLQVPAFGESGWFQPGPKPGDAGHAVIAGHVDSKTGPDVFHGLHNLRPGDAVRVRMSTGAVLAFSVDEVDRQRKEALPDSPMWRPTDRPRLALLTCGGRFDRKRRTYPDNVVVYASMAP